MVNGCLWAPTGLDPVAPKPDRPPVILHTVLLMRGKRAGPAIREGAVSPAPRSAPTPGLGLTEGRLLGSVANFVGDGAGMGVGVHPAA